VLVVVVNVLLLCQHVSPRFFPELLCGYLRTEVKDNKSQWLYGCSLSLPRDQLPSVESEARFRSHFSIKCVH